MTAVLETLHRFQALPARPEDAAIGEQASPHLELIYSAVVLQSLVYTRLKGFPTTNYQSPESQLQLQAIWEIASAMPTGPAVIREVCLKHLIHKTDFFFNNPPVPERQVPTMETTEMLLATDLADTGRPADSILPAPDLIELYADFLKIADRPERAFMLMHLVRDIAVIDPKGEAVSPSRLAALTARVRGYCEPLLDKPGNQAEWLKTVRHLSENLSQHLDRKNVTEVLDQLYSDAYTFGEHEPIAATSILANANPDFWAAAADKPPADREKFTGWAGQPTDNLDTDRRRLSLLATAGSNMDYGDHLVAGPAAIRLFTHLAQGLLPSSEKSIDYCASQLTTAADLMAHTVNRQSTAQLNADDLTALLQIHDKAARITFPGWADRYDATKLRRILIGLIWPTPEQTMTKLINQKSDHLTIHDLDILVNAQGHQLTNPQLERGWWGEIIRRHLQSTPAELITKIIDKASQAPGYLHNRRRFADDLYWAGGEEALRLAGITNKRRLNAIRLRVAREQEKLIHDRWLEIVEHSGTDVALMRQAIDLYLISPLQASLTSETASQAWRIGQIKSVFANRQIPQAVKSYLEIQDEIYNVLKFADLGEILAAGQAQQQRYPLIARGYCQAGVRLGEIHELFAAVGTNLLPDRYGIGVLITAVVELPPQKLGRKAKKFEKLLIRWLEPISTADHNLNSYELDQIAQELSWPTAPSLDGNNYWGELVTSKLLTTQLQRENWRAFVAYTRRP